MAKGKRKNTKAAEAGRDPATRIVPSSTLARVLQERDAAVETAEKLQREVVRLQEMLSRLQRRSFGKRSEKLDPAQLLLFSDAAELEDAGAEAPAEPEPADLAPDGESVDDEPRKKKRGPRAPSPPVLPPNTETQQVDHPVEDRECHQCGAEMARIGWDESEVIEYVPGRFVREVHRRERVACSACEECVVRAPAQGRVLWKCMPGTALAVMLLVSKYVDHLPLYRISRKFERLGALLSRSTLCGWVMKLADLLHPIVEEMRKEVLAQPYVATDDTPIKAFSRIKKKRKLSQAHLWPYLAGPHVVFDFTLSRSRDGPEAFLEGFQGYLQTDDYSGYRRLQSRPEIVGVGCMAHARRKFVDAMQGKAPLPLVLPVIASLRALYAIEKSAREHGLSPLQRLRLRHEQSRPVLAELLRAVRGLDQNDDVLPRSELGGAVRYLLRNRRLLTRYTRDGLLEIDNNRVENAIRPIALGRKNWLFAGSERGGHAAATIYSLIESCKRGGIPVDRYFTEALKRLTEDPKTDPRTLMPSRLSQPAEPNRAPEATTA